MKCLPLHELVDVCVSVDVKLIYRKPGTGDLRFELVRREAQLKAQHIGRTQEAAIADAVRTAMAEEEIGAG
ncbi:MAG: hypothetical protein EHM15_11655 [Desulfobacteraceae bacterium]|nr:MAG: hypothetical protein EHM15_11655 [Desulfobacteraceae bacterium]